MPESSSLLRRVYDFAPLNRFPLGKRFLIRAMGLAASLLLHMLGRTLRWRIEGWENFELARASGRGIIFTCWHNRVLLATWFWRRRGIVVMSSLSFDGEYVARFIQRFGYGAARGSSSRGASRALLTMVACMRHGRDTGFTIDGPRGPRYVVKGGATLLAKKTGGLILPFHISCRHYWEAGSWDRLQIPCPFTKAVIVIGEPMAVPPEASNEETERVRSRLQCVLDRLRESGDRL